MWRGQGKNNQQVRDSLQIKEKETEIMSKDRGVERHLTLAAEGEARSTFPDSGIRRGEGINTRRARNNPS